MIKTLLAFLALAFATPTHASDTAPSETQMQTYDHNKPAVDDLDYSQLDAGIRDTVRWLRARGYHTSDSGDGTKAGEMDCAWPVPMVVIQVPRDELAKVCDAIASELQARGISLSEPNTDPYTPGAIVLHGSYDPRSKAEGVIVLSGVDDALLASTVEPYEPRTEAEARDIDAQAGGQVGYQAYAQSTGGKTFDGRDMPRWEQLPERIQQAWIAATQAAHRALS